MEAQKPAQNQKENLEKSSATTANPSLWKSLTSNLALKLLIIGIFLLISVLSVVAITIARGQRPTLNGFVETGNIRVNSDPTDVQAFINDKPVALQDKLITGLEPGTYVLKLIKQGYLSWEKEVTIQAGIVLDVNMKLFPEQLKLEQLTKSNVQATFYSTNGEYVYYVVNNASKSEDNGIWRQRIADASTFNIFNGSDRVKITGITSNIAEAIRDNEFNIKPSFDNRKLILEITKPAALHFILDATTANEPHDNNTLEKKISYAIEGIDWLTNSESLLLRSGNLLTEYDLNTTITNVIEYGTSKPIFARSQDRVYRVVTNSAKQQKLLVYQDGISKEVKLENISLPAEISDIYTTQTNVNVIAFKTTKGDLYYLDLVKFFAQKIGSNLQFVTFSEDGRGLVVKNAVNTAILPQPAPVFSVFTAREVLALNTIETRLTQIRVGNVTEVKFSPASINLLLYTSENELYIADRDGNNPVPAITDSAKVVAENYGMNSNGSKIFALISEKTPDGSGATPTEIRNIYSADLKLR